MRLLGPPASSPANVAPWTNDAGETPAVQAGART